MRMLVALSDPATGLQTAGPRLEQLKKTIEVKQGKTAAWLVNYLLVRGDLKAFYYDGARIREANLRNLKRTMDDEVNGIEDAVRAEARKEK